MPDLQKPTPPWAIALAWILVMIPMGWGVYESVVKSLPLLHVSAAERRLPSDAPK
jgi:hypothetical protein